MNNRVFSLYTLSKALMASAFFRYAEEQVIPTSLCSARGVMGHTIVIVSILRTRYSFIAYT